MQFFPLPMLAGSLVALFLTGCSTTSESTTRVLPNKLSDNCKSAISRKKYAEAFNYCSRDADQGIPLAQFNVGLMYQNGHGVNKDIGKAVELFEKAAKNNDAAAKYQLGYLHSKGILNGGPEQVIYWYQQAAEQHYVLAKTSLGIIYVNQGNLQEAEKLLLSAAKAGDPRAMNYLAIIYLVLDKDKSNDMEGFNWAQNGANKGNPNAQYYVGMSYGNGYPVEKDINKALYWHSMAASNGNPDSQARMAMIYYEGKYIKKDLKLAYAFATLSAQQDFQPAYGIRDRIQKSLQQQEINEALHMSNNIKKYINLEHFL